MCIDKFDERSVWKSTKLFFENCLGWTYGTSLSYQTSSSRTFQRPKISIIRLCLWRKYGAGAEICVKRLFAFVGNRTQVCNSIGEHSAPAPAQLPKPVKEVVTGAILFQIKTGSPLTCRKATRWRSSSPWAITRRVGWRWDEASTSSLSSSSWRPSATTRPAGLRSWKSSTTMVTLYRLSCSAVWRYDRDIESCNRHQEIFVTHSLTLLGLFALSGLGVCMVRLSLIE